MFPFLVIDCVLFYFDWWNKWYKNIFPCHVVLSPKVIKLQIRPILFGRIWYATQILLPKLAQWYFATQTCPMIFCNSNFGSPNLPNDILPPKPAQWYFATQILALQTCPMIFCHANFSSLPRALTGTVLVKLILQHIVRH